MVVANEVIARYFTLERIETLPVSSIAITPANYNFHLRGEVMAGTDKAYIYDIKPRKERDRPDQRRALDQRGDEL